MRVPSCRTELVICGEHAGPVSSQTTAWFWTPTFNWAQLREPTQCDALKKPRMARKPKELWWPLWPVPCPCPDELRAQQLRESRRSDRPSGNRAQCWAKPSCLNNLLVVSHIRGPGIGWFNTCCPTLTLGLAESQVRSQARETQVPRSDQARKTVAGSSKVQVVRRDVPGNNHLKVPSFFSRGLPKMQLSNRKDLDIHFSLGMFLCWAFNCLRHAPLSAGRSKIHQKLVGEILESVQCLRAKDILYQQ